MIDSVLITLVLFLIVLAAIFIGLEVFLRLNLKNRFSTIETLLIAAGLGFGALALITFFTGVLQVLYLYVLIAVVIPLIFLNFSTKLKMLKSLPWGGYYNAFIQLSSLFKVFAIMLLVFVTLNFFRGLLPLMDLDSLAAYLDVPKHYVNHHGIISLKFTVWDDLPLNVQMINAIALMAGNEVLAKLLTGWTFGVLSMLIVFVTAKRLVNTEAGVIAALLYYTIPEFAWLTYTTKIDLGWALWEFLTFFLLITWIFLKDKSSAQNILLLAFIFLGLALGTKYLSFLSLIGYNIVLLATLFFDKKMNWESLLRLIVTANLIVFCVAFPHYLKNLVFTGNPIYPYLFTESSDRSLDYVQKGIDQELSAVLYYLNMVVNYFWNLFFDKNFFLDAPTLKGGAAYMGGLIIAFLPSFLLDKKRRLLFFIFIIAWVAYTLVMMQLYAPQVRHLINTLPLIIIPASAGFYQLMRQKNIFRYAFFGLLFVPLFYLIIFQTRAAITEHVPVAIGLVSRDAFLEDNFFNRPVHLNKDMVAYVKNDLSADALILSLDSRMGYYIDKPLTNNSHLPDRFIYRENDPEVFLHNLQELGITHIHLIQADELTDSRPRGQTLLLRDDFFKKHLEHVFTSEHQQLYRFIYP